MTPCWVERFRGSVAVLLIQASQVTTLLQSHAWQVVLKVASVPVDEDAHFVIGSRPVGATDVLMARAVPPSAPRAHRRAEGVHHLDGQQWY